MASCDDDGTNRTETCVCSSAEKWLYTYQPCRPSSPPGGRNTSTYLQERERERERETRKSMTARSIISQLDERALPLFPLEKTEELFCASRWDARSENERRWKQKSRMNLRTASGVSARQELLEKAIEHRRRGSAPLVQHLKWDVTLSLRSKSITSARSLDLESVFGIEIKLLSWLQRLTITNNTHQSVWTRYQETLVCFLYVHINRTNFIQNIPFL